VNVGSYPIGAVYDSGKSEVFVANSGDGTISVISDATNAVVATVGVGTHPSGFAYDSSKGEVFLVYSAGASVSVISDAVSTVTGTTTTRTTSSAGSTTATSSKTTVACTTTPTTAPSATSPGVGGWAQANCYPTDISGQSCPIYGGYIYCVGGYTDSGPTNSVYFASVSSAGVGAWTATTDYPQTVGGLSCAIAGGYITCVGGTDGSTGSAIDYIAPVSSAGVGAWVYGTYSAYIYDTSCVVSGGAYGYIYCVGGNDGVRDSVSSALGVSSDVYYSQLNPAGVNAWYEPIVGSAGSYSNDYYPATVESQSCVASVGYIYCIGGFTVTLYHNSSSTITATYVPGILSAVYSAPLSSSGEGAWVRAGSYPTTIFGQSCATSGGTIYCVGGDTIATGNGPTGAVNYASVTSAGVGAWVPTTSYPFNDEEQSCGISGGYIFCVGGLVNGASTNAVCYAQISNSTSGSGAQAPSTCAAPKAASSATGSSTLQTTSSSSSSSTSTSSSLSAIYLGLVMVNASVVLVLARLGLGRRRRRD
jgi:YVTN family beta-propeller protein